MGDKVEMLFMDGEGRPRRDRFVVSGLYDTGFEELDRTTALTDLRNVQRIASPDNGLISGYEIMAAQGVDAADVAAEAEQAIETAFYAGDESVGSAAAVTLRERYPVVFDWLKTHDVNARVILAVMMAVMLFNMASAMLIMVLDRTGMIGVLKAMGMRNGAVRRVFLYRAAMLFVRGAAWGQCRGAGYRGTAGVAAPRAARPRRVYALGAARTCGGVVGRGPQRGGRGRDCGGDDAAVDDRGAHKPRTDPQIPPIAAAQGMEQKKIILP